MADSIPTERGLASLDQVARFVSRWYQAVRPVMGWDEAMARYNAVGECPFCDEDDCPW